MNDEDLNLEEIESREWENTVALTLGEDDEAILPVEYRVFHVCARKFIYLLTRLDKVTVFGWQHSLLASYQCLWDLITGIPIQDRKRDVVTWFWWPKFCEHMCTCLVRGLWKTIEVLRYLQSLSSCPDVVKMKFLTIYRENKSSRFPNLLW